MNYIKKATLTLLTLATLVGCAKVEDYTAKSVSGKDLKITLTTTSVNIGDDVYRLFPHNDTTMSIYNPRLKKGVSYINFEGGPIGVQMNEHSINLVDRIELRNSASPKSKCLKIYNRGDEGTDSLFVAADSDYRNKVNLFKENQKKSLDSELQNVKDIISK
jgi:hypothetical protein